MPAEAHQRAIRRPRNARQHSPLRYAITAANHSNRSVCPPAFAPTVAAKRITAGHSRLHLPLRIAGNHEGSVAWLATITRAEVILAGLTSAWTVSRQSLGQHAILADQFRHHRRSAVYHTSCTVARSIFVIRRPRRGTHKSLFTGSCAFKVPVGKGRLRFLIMDTGRNGVRF